MSSAFGVICLQERRSRATADRQSKLPAEIQRVFDRKVETLAGHRAEHVRGISSQRRAVGQEAIGNPLRKEIPECTQAGLVSSTVLSPHIWRTSAPIRANRDADDTGCCSFRSSARRCHFSVKSL
jgi:hypothetical protein